MTTGGEQTTAPRGSDFVAMLAAHHAIRWGAAVAVLLVLPLAMANGYQR